MDDEDEDGIDGQLHLYLSHWLADAHPSRRWDTIDSVGGKSGLCQHMCPRTRVPELLR